MADQQYDLSQLRFDPNKLPARQNPTAPTGSDGFGWDDAGALGIRAAGGFLSSMGSVPGAAIGGASEALAQLVEFLGGARPTIKDRLGRIGVEAAASAVPGAGIVKGGRVLNSALRSGALTAASDLGRQTFDETPGYDLSQTAAMAAGGGALGGLLGKITPRSISPDLNAAPAARPSGPAGNEVVDNAGRPISTKFTINPRNDEVVPRLGPGQPLRTSLPGVAPEAPIAGVVDDIDPSLQAFTDILGSGGQPIARTPGSMSLADEAPFPSGNQPTPIGIPFTPTPAQSRLQLLDENEAAIQRAIEEGGLTPQAPNVRQTVKAGDMSMTTPFAAPEDEAAEEGVDLVKALFGAGSRAAQSNPVIAESAQNLDEIQREILDAWVRLGETPRLALKNAIRYEAPFRAEDGRLTKTFVGRAAQQSMEGVPAEAGVVEDLARELGIEPVLPGAQKALGGVADDLPLQTAPPAPAAPVEAPIAPQAPSAPQPAPAPRLRGQEAIDYAQNNFPPEVNDELNKLGDAYRGLQKGPEKRKIGQQMAEIRNFMMGQGQFAPKAPDIPASPAQGAQGIADDLAQSGIAPRPLPIEATAEEIAAGAKAGRPVGAAADAEQIEILKRALDPRGESGAINPDLLLRFLTGGTGALAGAAYDDENPLRGAAVGGAAGFAAPSLPALIRGMGAPDSFLDRIGGNVDTARAQEIAKQLWATLPQWQRASYLTDITGGGTAANVFAGPYGSSLMAGIELALSGDPRGMEILKQLNPVSFGRGIKENWPEAQRLIKEGELGRHEGLNIDPDGVIGRLNQEVLAAPGTAMTAGDVTARKVLETGGVDDKMARRFTLTSEPEFKFFKDLANLWKGSTVGSLIAPFKRTPANITEQGMIKAPLLGFLIQHNRVLPDSIRQQVVQQLMSAGVGVGAYELGEANPDNRALRKFITNLAGSYSMPATIGMALGQASGRGQSPSKVLLTPRVAENFVGPIPTTEPITDAIGGIGRLMGVEGFEDARFPPGLIPRELATALGLNDRSERLRSLAQALPSLRNLR